ncbi:hypothetical protein SSX86_025671 [Deinandra increscens subsp. villosa]|uniref:Mediator of RNA polymerase II transcription subunit 30 n=1 Tax=Deinandra increscens subsp. villosa TaxID=3103831 RepID=A0AAP0CIZ5_9ASTR
MEETSSTTTTGQKSTQELAMEGQKYLEDTIQSAFHILSSLNEELCNPHLWSSSSPHPNFNGHHAPPSNGVTNGDTTSSDASHQFEIGGGALDEARLRYKSSVAALRSVVTAIPNSEKAKAYEIDPVSIEELDIERLEDKVSALRKEVEDKNKHLKSLIDQTRELIEDVSAWQSPVAR